MIHVLVHYQPALLIALDVIVIGALYVMVCHQDPYDPPTRRRR